MNRLLLLIVSVMLAIFAIAGIAQAHSLGFNGIADNTIEVGKDSSLGVGWIDIRNDAMQKYNTWRVDKTLGYLSTGTPSISKPHTGDGPTDTVMRKDNSNDAFLQYWDVSRSPDLQGINTQTSSNQSAPQKAATTIHEWFHANGGAHTGDASYCSTSLLTSFALCGGYANNTRRLTPGPHDTVDARGADPDTAWSDYDQIGNWPSAGDTSISTQDVSEGTGDEAGSGADVMARYGSISNAIEAGVVFEWVDSATAEQYAPIEEEYVEEHPGATAYGDVE